MKNTTLKGIFAGILAGAVTVSSVPVIAKNIEALMNSVNIRLNDREVATIDQSYELQNGSKVPYSILYEGTTYLPVRKISELLDVEIDWDNDTRTVLIDKTQESGAYDPWGGAPDFGKTYGIKEIAQVPTIYSTTHWYDVKDVDDESLYVEELEKYGFERVEEGGVKPRFKVYKRDNTEIWLDLGMYTKLVYSVTVVDTTRPVTGREFSYSGKNEDIPNFASAFGFISKSIDGLQCTIGEWDMWSYLPDYFTLLENEGFKVSSVDRSFYGKSFTLKKDRSVVVVKFDGTEMSNIPAVTIDY